MLLASIIRIYHDAQSSECQIQYSVSSAGQKLNRQDLPRSAAV